MPTISMKNTLVRVGVIAAALSLTLTACGSDSNDEAHAPKVGDLLSTAPLTGSPALPDAATNSLVTYASSNEKGDIVVTSGTVSIPKGTAPDGGWPVISWAHGTTGVADTCAPSEDTPDGPSHDYLAGVDTVLNKYLNAGYAVVQTDYQGLGTPGGHPYMNGVTEANAVTDIVSAAHHVSDNLSNDWFVMSHSQGGHAALWTAADGADRAPDLKLKGAISIAPGSDLAPMVPMLESGDPVMAPALAFYPVILLGAQAADPTIVADDYVTPQSAPLLKAARTGCLAAIRDALPGIPVKGSLNPKADMNKLVDYLKKQSTAPLQLKVPTVILQGKADTVVAEPGTTALVKKLCGNGQHLAYKTYEGTDHRAAVDRGYDDALAFMKDATAGTTYPGTC